MATGFLNVAKKVLRKAIKLGVEEAGVRVCGKIGWDAIKVVVTPVIEELERRYPKLMIVPEEMDEAERDLDSDLTLENLVQESLAAIETGQKEILTVLFRNEETLASYRGLFMHAFEEADSRAEERHKVLLSEIRRVKTDVQADIQELGTKPTPVITPSHSLQGIYEQANSYQHDAMTWITADHPAVAAERLSIARTLVMGGMARMGESAELMITMGYIEKSQAQVCFAEGNLDGATRYLADAARFFNEALKLRPEDLGALNGMANIYFYGGDLDTAIELGRTIMHTDPNYGAAAWDLGLALEQKIKASDGTSDQRLLREGIEVDERLVEMMPKQPSAFRSSDLNHVQERLAYYRAIYNSVNKWVEKAEEDPLEVAQLEVYRKQQQFFTLFNANNASGALDLTRETLDYIDQNLLLYPDDSYLKAVQGCCRTNETMALRHLGHYDEAEKSLEIANQIFKEMTDKRPKDPMVWHGRGKVEMLRKKWQNALQYTDRALELRSDYPAALRDRETIIESLKQTN